MREHFAAFLGLHSLAFSGLCCTLIHILTYIQGHGTDFFSQGDLPKHFCDETKDLFFVTGANSIPLFSFLHYSDDELRFMYENGQGHLTLFCIVFV